MRDPCKFSCENSRKKVIFQMRLIEAVLIFCALFALSFFMIQPHENRMLLDDGQIEFSGDTEVAQAARYLNGKANLLEGAKCNF